MNLSHSGRIMRGEDLCGDWPYSDGHLQQNKNNNEALKKDLLAKPQFPTKKLFVNANENKRLLKVDLSTSLPRQILFL